MKLIIDIPEDVYRRLKAGDTNAGNTFHNTALEAIGNGTPYDTSGDLISRDDLKKAINDFYDEFFDGCFSSALITYAKGVDEIIDNAPIVEAYPFEQVQELVKLNQQFAQEIENLKRPQGEWKLHGMIYYCSECGHDCGESGDNFCGNCGADMRKGDTE